MELYRRHILATDAALPTVVVLMRLATDHREVNRFSERESVVFLEAAPKKPLLGLTPAEVRSAIKAAKRATRRDRGKRVLDVTALHTGTGLVMFPDANRVDLLDWRGRTLWSSADTVDDE